MACQSLGATPVTRRNARLTLDVALKPEAGQTAMPGGQYQIGVETACRFVQMALKGATIRVSSPVAWESGGGFAGRCARNRLFWPGDGSLLPINGVIPI